MNIIFGRDNAEKLREKYTVLDLETLIVEDNKMEVFCLVPGDKIAIQDLPQLESWTKLHDDFLQAYKDGQYAFCKECIENLKGKFGGELDSFYEEILKRIEEKDVKV